MAHDSATTLARELTRGAVVLAPNGADITQPVRSAFHRLLPATGGDRAAAAARAVQTALAEWEVQR